MNDADEALTEETVRLQGEIDETNADLAAEVEKGVIRDDVLTDHNIRLTVLRGDVDENTDELVDLNEELDDKFQELSDDIRNVSDSFNDALYETDRYFLNVFFRQMVLFRLIVFQTDLKN